MAMNKWHVTRDSRILRRAGKTGEELCEAGAVVCRIVIQGIDEVDPSSGKTNRARLQDELADVRAQIDCTAKDLGLDQAYMARRTAEKVQQMSEWELLVADDDPAPLDLLLRGLAIADARMFDLLETESIAHDEFRTVLGLTNEDQQEVGSLAEASEALQEAVGWLQERGYVEVAEDGSGEYVNVLRRPGEDD